MRTHLWVALAVAFVLIVIFPISYEIVFRPGSPIILPSALVPGVVQPALAQSVLGKMAPDFTLSEINGKVVHLHDYHGRVPVVVEFGSFTCPYCVRQISTMDTLATKYADRVQFLFVYGEEAHPGIPFFPSGYTSDRAPFREVPSAADRLAAAHILQSDLEVQRIVLVEPVGETVPLRDQYLHGPWQNSAFMVAPDGSIVYAARWLKADALETFLETYLASGGKCHPVASEGPP